MSRLLIIVMMVSHLGLAAARAQEPSQPAEPTMRVMSFNIRYGTADDGENAWPHRRDCLVRTIEAFAPDLLGVQEALEFQVEFLEERFGGYAMHGVGREDGRQKGEYAAVFYRRERFELLDAGHFWLSEQPDVPGSVSWDSSLTRMASWVRLRDRRTGQAFTFCNTHWDHRGDRARLESARLIRRRLSDQPNLILMGDLNCTEEDAPVRALLEGDTLRDTYRLLHPTPGDEERTFHGFSGKREGRRIDFIFCTDVFHPTAAAIDDSACDGRYPSDHYPVTAILGPSD